MRSTLPHIIRSGNIWALDFDRLTGVMMVTLRLLRLPWRILECPHVSCKQGSIAAGGWLASNRRDQEIHGIRLAPLGYTS